MILRSPPFEQRIFNLFEKISLFEIEKKVKIKLDLEKLDKKGSKRGRIAESKTLSKRGGIARAKALSHQKTIAEDRVGEEDISVSPYPIGDIWLLSCR